MGLKPISIDATDRLTCLVLGKAGVGKTSLLRTIPPDEKALVLSAEGGLLCVRDLVQSGQVEGFEITSIQDFQEAFQALAHDQDYKDRYKWVFIDSLTEISDQCLKHFKEVHAGSDNGFKIWGEHADTLTGLVKGFRDLFPYNVVFTCLPEADKDENNRLHYGPNVDGKAFKTLATSYFDLVLFMIIDPNDEQQNRRVFLTQEWNHHPAKDRSGQLDPFELPNLAHIKNKIMGVPPESQSQEQKEA